MSETPADSSQNYPTFVVYVIAFDADGDGLKVTPKTKWTDINLSPITLNKWKCCWKKMCSFHGFQLTVYGMKLRKIWWKWHSYSLNRWAFSDLDIWNFMLETWYICFQCSSEVTFNAMRDLSLIVDSKRISPIESIFGMNLCFVLAISSSVWRYWHSFKANPRIS